MIDSLPDFIEYAALICIGGPVLFAGIAGTNARRARSREALRQPEPIQPAAEELKVRKVAVIESPAPVIGDRDHPLYCRAGARRGPDLQGRSR